MKTYNVKVKNVFEGPMDLLWHLITKHKIDIYDIPISDLTKQYLDYLTTLKSFNIEISSEFLIMAATLLQIKARMMLPRRSEEEELEEDPRIKLVESIIEYRRYKEVSQVMFNMVTNQEQFCARDPMELPVEFIPPQNIPIAVLIDAFKLALKLDEEVTIPEVLVKREEFHIEDKINEVLKILKDSDGEIFFWDIFKNPSKTELIITFLAILELIRNGKIFVTQKYNFSEIYIKEVIPNEGDSGDT